MLFEAHNGVFSLFFLAALEYLLHDRVWVASRAVCICVCISLCSGVASYCLCLHVSDSRGSVTETLNWGVWMGENVVTDEQSLSAEGLRERNVDAQGWRQEVIISQCGNKLRGTTKLR